MKTLDLSSAIADMLHYQLIGMLNWAGVSADWINEFAEGYNPEVWGE